MPPKCEALAMRCLQQNNPSFPTQEPRKGHLLRLRSCLQQREIARAWCSRHMVLGRVNRSQLKPADDCYAYAVQQVANTSDATHRVLCKCHSNTASLKKRCRYDSHRQCIGYQPNSTEAPTFDSLRDASIATRQSVRGVVSASLQTDSHGICAGGQLHEGFAAADSLHHGHRCILLVLQ